MHSGGRSPESLPVLVVGGGLAATALVAALRTGGLSGPIVVASAEARLPYDRPPLTKELFERDAPADLCTQFGLDPRSVEWLLGARAIALHPGPAGAVVTLRAGGATREVAARAVVVATGAGPALPARWAGARTLSTWEDAHSLRAALHPGTHLVIVGAGWIGVELAGAAATAGVRVTVVDAGGPLGALLPPAVGERIAGWLRAAGVTLVAGTVAGASATEVVLDDATRLRGDLVVAAVGVRPATHWLPAGWRTPTGHVRTDGRGRAAPGVWAIGDCAARDGVVDQHWNAAVDAAQRCAADLLGTEPPAPRPPAVFSTVLGHSVDLVGRSRPDLQVLWREGEGWTALLLDAGSLVAGLAVDRPRDVAALRRLLAAGATPLDRAAAADPGRPLRDAADTAARSGRRRPPPVPE